MDKEVLSKKSSVNDMILPKEDDQFFSDDFREGLERIDPSAVLAFPDPEKKMNEERERTSENREKKDVTIILNIWKREYLEEQLASLFAQSVLPKEIWVIHYEDFVESKNVIDFYRDKFENICLIKSDKNLKYFGRFSLAINVTTKYVWLIDDDVIPGKFWLSNCVQKCEALNAVISCTGRIIPPNDFQPENISKGKSMDHFIGDVKYHRFINYCPVDTQVDYACNGYFLKSEWLSAFWSIWPATFLSGEDIHLSATCMTKFGVKTYVIEQTDNNTSGNTKKFYGGDDIASYKQSNFVPLREKVIKHHVLGYNWIPLQWQAVANELSS